MSWIQTVSGKQVSFTDPAADTIDIEDIAHALSMLCRFNGHGTRFYSVAEHSVHVSHEVHDDLALIGLLHDAAEAYLGDIPSPLKQHLADFKRFESRMESVIAAAFGVRVEDFRTPELKRADIQLLADEKAVLMIEEPAPWPVTIPAPGATARIKAWSSQQARAAFLQRYEEPT